MLLSSLTANGAKCGALTLKNVKTTLTAKKKGLRLHFDALPSYADTPVCRDPVCHSLSVLYNRFKEIFAVVWNGVDQLQILRSVKLGVLKTSVF